MQNCGHMVKNPEIYDALTSLYDASTQLCEATMKFLRIRFHENFAPNRHSKMIEVRYTKNVLSVTENGLRCHPE